jgi:BppU N-terminal domain
MDDGTVIDLTGTTVQLTIKKPSGMTIFQLCDLTDPLMGLAEVTLDNQAYIEIGNHSAEIVITSADVVSVTRSFSYTSLDAILDDTTLESQNDWADLHEILLSADKKPILGAGSPNNVVTPEYQGQSYLDTTNMVMYYASTLAIDSWRSYGTGGGGGTTGGSVTWADVLDKPAVFPPSPHTHLWSEIEDRPTTMTPTAHTHLWADITDKPVTFPPDPHEHPEYLTEGEADGLYQAIGTVPTHTHFWADITDKPLTFPPPIMGSGVGGARVGNGLKMVGEYLTIRDGLGIKTNATTYALDVDKTTMDTWYVQNATGQDLTLWKGNQTAYDAITTKDPNTVYFITP